MIIDDADKTLLFLSLLAKYFKQFKDALIYGKKSTITLDKVHTVVRFKEFSILKVLKIDDNGEGLNVSR